MKKGLSFPSASWNWEILRAQTYKVDDVCARIRQACGHEVLCMFRRLCAAGWVFGSISTAALLPVGRMLESAGEGVGSRYSKCFIHSSVDSCYSLTQLKSCRIIILWS